MLRQLLLPGTYLGAGNEAKAKVRCMAPRVQSVRHGLAVCVDRVTSSHDPVSDCFVFGFRLAGRGVRMMTAVDVRGTAC